MSSVNASVILIVDSSEDNIEILRATLGGDYNLAVAVSGETALKSIKKIEPDLVLLEVMLPGIDGFEVLRRIRNIPECASVPVIFVTSELNSYSEVKGLRLGAADYITKPYNPEIVSIKVRNQLLNKTYRDRLEKLIDQRTNELISSRDAIIMGMSLISEGRSADTGEHLKGIKRRTEILIHKYNEIFCGRISREETERIIRACPLHDIGKVYISDTILMKNSKLTPDEFELIKMHTILGASVLRETENLLASNTELLETAIEISEGHHEKYDGSGYPYGKRGNEIPISARIVALADVFDALMSKRPYKEAMPRDFAIKLILDGDGQRIKPCHFDPDILEVFKQVADYL